MRRTAAFVIALVLAFSTVAPGASNASARPGGPGPAPGKPVEVLAQRTETQQVFTNPDGTSTLIQHARPVRVRRGGGWVPVDTTLTARADGTVAPMAAAVELSFSGGRGTPLARIGRNGATLTLDWPGGLPAPELDGNTATYREILPGVDLMMSADVTGFSEVIIVKTREAAANPRLRRLRFSTSTQGLNIRKDAAGNIDAVDDDGKVVVHAPVPQMWDSSATQGDQANPRSLATEPATGGKRARLGVAYAPGKLELTPVQNLLTSPKTRFPVYIDPAFGAGRVAWTYVSKVFHTAKNWNSSSVAKSGFYSDPESTPTSDTARSFFLMGSQAVNGKHILSATFRTFENWAFSCSPRVVELWLTGAISSSTDWDHQPAWTRLISSQNVAKGYEPQGCADGGVDFDATSAVAQAAAAGWPGVTLGLKAQSETDKFGWKKFNNNPTLEITFNTVPPTPDQLSTDPVTDCVSGSARPYISTPQPTLRARVSDGINETVGARFEWWVTYGAMIGGQATNLSTPGLTRQATVPAGAFADGGTYSWRVRAEDGTDVSGWGPWCEFTVDATAPGQPAGVTSTALPENDFGGRVGEPAEVTFSSGGVSDVAGYVYSLNSDPPATLVAAPVLGGPVTLNIVPAKQGLNVLRVRTKDRAGNQGPIRTYNFFAFAATGTAGEWTADEGTGTTLADASGNDHPATLTGTSSWTDGRSGKAVTLDGLSGSAATAGPVLRTDKSFTVAAWVRQSASKPWANIISQDGSRAYGFSLHGGSALGRWGLTMTAADSDNTGAVRAVSAAPSRLNTWTHLIGSYDATAKQLRLYVDGVLAGSAAHTSTWNAAGPLRIGAASWNGVQDNKWPGDIDQVNVWQRLLGDEEIRDLAKVNARLGGHWNFDEGTGSTASDGSGNGNDATLSGTWAQGRSPEAGTALSLNGTTGHAKTTGPVLRTDRSFTVSTWVRLNDRSRYQTMLCQQGASLCAFYLQYDQGTDRFRMIMADKDSGTPAAWYYATSAAPVQLGVWTHITGVYDSVAKQIRIYRNGVLEGTAAHPGPGWQGIGPLNIGRAATPATSFDYVNGQIDDARVWQEVLPAWEIRALSENPPAFTGHWQLNEGTGTVAGDETGNGNTATLTGGVRWGSGPAGAPGTALTFSGTDGRAATTGPVVRTDSSFTVSAWVRMTDKTRYQTVLCQQGAFLCAFYLQYDLGLDRLRIIMSDKDSSAPAAWYFATTSGPPQAGVWTHITGVYDAAAKQVRLYRNGVLEGVAGHPGPAWHGTGPLNMGRVSTSGYAIEYFAGDVSDVRTYSGVLTDDEIFQVANQP